MHSISIQHSLESLGSPLYMQVHNYFWEKQKLPGTWILYCLIQQHPVILAAFPVCVWYEKIVFTEDIKVTLSLRAHQKEPSPRTETYDLELQINICFMCQYSDQVKTVKYEVNHIY